MKAIATLIATAVVVTAGGVAHADRSSDAVFLPLAAEMARADWHPEVTCDFPIRDHVGRC
jgi:hypothetical protein